MDSFEQPRVLTNVSGGASVNMCPQCNIVTMLARCSNCGNLTVSIRPAPNNRTRATPPPPPPPTSMMHHQQLQTMGGGGGVVYPQHMPYQETTPLSSSIRQQQQQRDQQHAPPPPPPPPPPLNQPGPMQQYSQYQHQPHQQHQPLPVSAHTSPHPRAMSGATPMNASGVNDEMQRLKGDVERWLAWQQQQAQQLEQQEQHQQQHQQQQQDQQQQPQQRTISPVRNNNTTAAPPPPPPPPQANQHVPLAQTPPPSSYNAPSPVPPLTAAPAPAPAPAATSQPRVHNPTTSVPMAPTDFETFPIRLDAELSQMRMTQEIMEQRLSDMSRQKASAESELSTMRSQLRQAQEDARLAKDDQSRMQRKLDSEQERLRTKTDELMRLQSEVADLRGENDLAAIEFKATQDDAHQLRNRLADESKRADALRAKMQEEIDKTRKELATVEKRYEAKLDEQAKKHAEDTQERSELLAKLRKFDHEAAGIKNEFEGEIATERTKAERERKRLEEECKRLSNESDAIRHRNASLDEQLAAARKELQSTDDALRDTRAKLSETSNQYVALRSDFDNKVAEKLAIQSDQLNKDRRDLKHMVDDARHREAIAVDRLSVLEKDIPDLRDKLQNAQAEAKEARSKLETEVGKCTAEMERHEETKEHSKKMQDMLNAELTKASDRVKNLTEELNLTNKTVNERLHILTEENAKLMHDNTEFREFTVSRDLEAELRSRLAATETERDEAVARRAEVVAIVDQLKEDRAVARKMQEKAEVETDRAMEVLRQIAQLMQIPGASVVSLESCVKTLVPAIEKAADVSRNAVQTEERLKEQQDALKKELDRLSDDLHRARCDVETERRASGDAADSCERAVAAAESKVKTLMRQVETERNIARDDIDCMAIAHEQQLSQIRAEKERIANEAKTYQIEINDQKNAMALLGKDLEAVSQARDGFQRDLMVLRKEHEKLKEELESTRADVNATKKRNADLEDDKMRLTKLTAQHRADTEESVMRQSSVVGRYEEEIEDLKTQLRLERQKVMHEIDMTHAAQHRAYSSQRQLDVAKADGDVASARMRLGSGGGGRVVDEENYQQHLSVASSLRGQGLAASPSASWNRTTIVSNNNVSNNANNSIDKYHSPVLHSPASTPPPSGGGIARRGEMLLMDQHQQQHNYYPPHQQHSSTTVSPEPRQMSDAERMAYEAQLWRESRIQHHPVVHGQEQAPLHASVGQHRSGPGGGGATRSVPLSQFRRK